MDTLKKKIIKELELRVEKEIKKLRNKLQSEGYKEHDIDRAIAELIEDGEI